jgi:hypothetical protein
MIRPDLAAIDFSEGRRELVLNLWALDFTADTIAQIVGLASAGSVTRMIATARRDGDPRACVERRRGGRKRRTV